MSYGRIRPGHSRQMNVRQQAFVQWLLTERIVVEEDAIQVVASLLSKGILADMSPSRIFVDCNSDDLYQFINPIRDELRPFDMDIPRIRYEPWQKYALGIINTNDDEIAKLATGYSATEIAAFKKIIDELAKAKQKSFQISQIDLKGILTSTKTLELSGTKAENLLQRFISDFMLHAQYFSLSPWYIMR